MLRYQFVYKPFRQLIDKDIRLVDLGKVVLPEFMGHHADLAELFTKKITHDIAERIPVDKHFSGICSRISVHKGTVHIIGYHLHTLNRITCKGIVHIVNGFNGSQVHQHEKISCLGVPDGLLFFFSGRNINSKFLKEGSCSYISSEIIPVGIQVIVKRLIGMGILVLRQISYAHTTLMSVFSLRYSTSWSVLQVSLTLDEL